MFEVGDNVHYYAVDHSPSYLWNSATWENSEALMPYLRGAAGPGAWDATRPIRRAIEIREGVIQNPGILSFQHRSPDYPHPRHCGLRDASSLTSPNPAAPWSAPAAPRCRPAPSGSSARRGPSIAADQPWSTVGAAAGAPAPGPRPGRRRRW